MQVGDRVFISPNSEFFGFSKVSNNPKNTLGVIYSTNSGTWKYSVKWKNLDKDCNSYKEDDLILANNLNLLLFGLDTEI